MKDVVRPSIDPAIVRRRRDDWVPRRFRKRSTDALHERLETGVIQDTYSWIMTELAIRASMLRAFLDPHDADYPHARQPNAATYEIMAVAKQASPPPPGPGEPDYYAPRPENDSQHRWYVRCRRESWPWSGALPHGFATREQAERAKAGLIAAGLGTPEALHRRIKLDMDWAGVKRIMIEALAW